MKLASRSTWRMTQFAPISRAKAGSGGPEIEISLPPGFSTASDFSSTSGPSEFSDYVVAAQPLAKIVVAVIDDDIRPEAP